MLAATNIQEEITQRVIRAIEGGCTPPWRKVWRPDLENSGFPSIPYSHPFGGIAVLLLNLSACEKGFGSRYWTTKGGWETLGGRVSGDGTVIFSRVDSSRWITVFNADQVIGKETDRFRSRRRAVPLTPDYAEAEAVIQASGATIHHRCGLEAAYYFPPADYIIFPFKEQFLCGPGGLIAYYDSLLHELAHFSEPRLGWDGPDDIRELRAEMTAPFLASRLGMPVLCDMLKIPNHRNHLSRWVAAMNADPTLIFQVADDASKPVEYLLSLKG